MSACVDCERPMRRQRANPAENPGTVRAGQLGRCWGCTQRVGRTASAVRAARDASYVVPLDPAMIATVVRRITALFPDEPELLLMLGVAS